MSDQLSIPRYGPDIDPGGNAYLAEDADGDWCRWMDVEATISALRAERDALQLSLDESIKEMSRIVQQMNELNRAYAELKAHSTGNLSVTARERDRLRDDLDKITAERDALLASEAEVMEKALHWEMEWEHVAEKHDQLLTEIAAMTREAEAALAAPDEAEVERIAQVFLNNTWPLDARPSLDEGYFREGTKAAIAAFLDGRKERAG